MTQNYDERDLAELRASGRFDESQSLFLARQLTHVRAEARQVKKAALNAFTVFPTQTDIPAGAETAVQRVYDSVGTAAVISNYSDDLPRVDLLAKETTVKVKLIGSAYGYNYRELANAQFAGMRLSTTKARAAKIANDTKLNRLAWKGDVEHGIAGFLGNENVSEYTLTADGGDSSDSSKFADKTDEQILRDLNAFVDAVGAATNYVETVNTLLLPPAVYALVATKRLSYSDRTVLEQFRAAHPEITRVMSVGELAGAGTGGKDVMVAGYFDPGYIKFEIPVRFDQLPVQYRNLEYVVNCVSTTAGVNISIPYAFVKAEGC